MDKAKNKVTFYNIPQSYTLFFIKHLEVMDLHIKERLLIPTILPERGNFMEYNLKKAILKKIAITEQDKADYEIVEKPEEKRIEWNVQKDQETPLTVDFTKDELEFMRKACETISEQDLPDEIWGVAERIYNESQC